MIAAAMTLASCNGDYDDWAAPQSNPQEEQVKLPGFTATAAQDVDLNNPGDSVQLFSLTTPALPEGATVGAVRVTMTPTDINDAPGLGTQIETDAAGRADSAAVQAVVEKYYGKKAEPRPFGLHVEADIMVGGQAMYVDAGLVSINITPKAPKYADYYYAVGALNGWGISSTDALFFRQSEGVFSYTTQWTGDHNLKFVSDLGLGSWDNAYGCAVDGDNSAEGAIVSGNPGAIKAPTGDEYYTLTIDMTMMKYTWTKLDNQNPAKYKNISIIGGFNGWSDAGELDLAEVTPHNWYATVTIPEAGELKLRANHAWTDSWGNAAFSTADVYGKLEYNGSNMNIPAGTYRVYFNDITGDCAFIAE